MTNLKGAATNAASVIEQQAAYLQKEAERLLKEAGRIREELKEGEEGCAAVNAESALTGLAKDGQLSLTGIRALTDISVALHA